MYPFTQDLSARQKNVSKGTNTCEYIVLHDTGVIGNGNIPILLGENGSRVSCHFLIRQDGTTYKLGDQKQILWHCGESLWEGRTNMNRYAVGIEVEGPGFTKAQKRELRPLVRHLMAVLNIPKDRVIRHRDISAGRKIDPADSLFGLSGFKLWRMILTPKEVG